MNLNHLYLLVRDVDRSVAFYRRYFEFDGPSGWQGETFVIRNREGFDLALTPAAEPPEWPAGLHFGFLLASVDEAKAIYARVAADDVPVLEVFVEDAFIVFKLRDPDGYVVEVEAGVPVAPPP